MRKIIIAILMLVLLSGVIYFFAFSQEQAGQNIEESATNETQKKDIEKQRILAENLQIPWEVVFLPSGEIFISERPGRIRKVGQDDFSINIPNVEHAGEGGLLGMAIHPNFSKNNWLYIYYTTRENESLVNRVERFTLINDRLENGTIILDGIPASSNHNGGRIAFGPDSYLYIATGDAGNSNLAQDIKSLAGKILRITDSGAIPERNLFDNAVYSFGHRNVQGLAWDEDGRLWANEHGRS